MSDYNISIRRILDGVFENVVLCNWAQVYTHSGTNETEEWISLTKSNWLLINAQKVLQ